MISKHQNSLIIYLKKCVLKLVLFKEITFSHDIKIYNIISQFFSKIVINKFRKNLKNI